MSWYTIFYLFSVADKLNIFLIVAGIFGLVGFVLTFAMIKVYHPSEKEEQHNQRLRTWRPRIIIISILCFLFSIITPSRKDLLLIIAGGAVGQFVTTDNNAKAIPADLTRFLRGQIQSATAELKENMLMDGEREKLEGLTKDQVVDMLMKEKAKALPDTLRP